MNQFTLEVLQAINNWQRGGTHIQKIKRGEKLKEVAQSLDVRFRSCSATCFRREAHDKSRLWELLAENSLPETISSWTIELDTAKSFKDGVPLHGQQGIIFRTQPSSKNIVLNLVEVYQASEFSDALHIHRSKITGFHEGIGRYGSSEGEVVLELGSLDRKDVYLYGGYASDREKLAQKCLGHAPSESDMVWFNSLCDQANIPRIGDWWLSPEGTQNVMNRVWPQIDNLIALKEAQTRAKNPG